MIDLLWLTDELRRERPEPVDEARNALFHLEDTARLAVPAVLADLADVLSRFGVELPLTATPLRFGAWTGGDRDGNPNVTPAVTMQVLTLQHEQGLRVVERWLAALVEELSVSSRIGGASEELLNTLAADLERLPEVDPRFRRINAEEPYRLKISCIRAKLARTRTRLARTLEDAAGELVDDLHLSVDHRIVVVAAVQRLGLQRLDQVVDQGAVLRHVEVVDAQKPLRLRHPRLGRGDGLVLLVVLVVVVGVAGVAVLAERLQLLLRRHARPAAWRAGRRCSRGRPRPRGRRR